MIPRGTSFSSAARGFCIACVWLYFSGSISGGAR